jgi:hypothetical protein
MCQDKLGNLVTGNAEVLNGKNTLKNTWTLNVIRNFEASGNIYYGPELEISELTDGV